MSFLIKPRGGRSIYLFTRYQTYGETWMYENMEQNDDSVCWQGREHHQFNKTNQKLIRRKDW